MTRLGLIAMLCAAILVVTATGARTPLQLASAPSPTGSVGGYADVLFMLSADNATFTSGSTLLLEGVSRTAASFRAGGRATAYPLPEFAAAAPGSKFVAADGSWMGRPDALLTGMLSGNGTQAQALLVLSQPVYDAQSRTLTLQIKQRAPQPQAVKYKGGAVSDSVAQHQVGAGPQLLTSPTAGTVLEGVVIFIDQNQRALQRPAQAEFGWGGSDSSLDFSNGQTYNSGSSTGSKSSPPPQAASKSSPPPAVPGQNSG